MNDCFYVSGRSDGADGGIYRFKYQKGAAPKLAGFSAFPGLNFLAYSPDRKHLYVSGSRNGEGLVGAFEVGAEGGLKFLKELPSGGKSACYVAASPDGKFLYCANYSSGSFTEFDLEDGIPTRIRRIVEHHGSGPNRARQECAHVHCTEISPDGNYLLVVDLGVDAVFSYRLTSEGIDPEPAFRFDCRPGAGPRHLTFAGDGKTAYLIYELGNSVQALRFENGRFSPLGEENSTLPRFWSGATKAAAVRISSDGAFLLASNRGFDSLAVFALDGQGGMKRVGLTYCGGKSPRDVNFLTVGNLVFAANEDSDSVTGFEFSGGRLSPTGVEYRIPSPNYVLNGF